MSYRYLPKRIKWVKCRGEDYTPQQVTELSQELSLPESIAQLLCMRGYCNRNSADKFINCCENEFFDPFLFSQMEKAVERINTALENGENICVYGDYDVDGITSTALLYSYLRDRGGKCSYYIPKRNGEGYGVCRPVIDMLKEQGTELIVTVDTGITAGEEISYAAELGIDMVVTDHHECHTEVPVCKGVVNPRLENNLPFYDFAGVGVSFKLACALESRSGRQKDMKRASDYIFGRYGDLVALGTIADVMPLKGENRTIVSRGLKLLKDNPRPGITQLLEKSGISLSLPAKEGTKYRTIDSSLVSFTIAPRLNAAGRLDDATLALHLLIAKNEDAAAADAFRLCQINTERQELEKKTTAEAVAILNANPEMLEDKIIVLAKEGWSNGIIGIVASRITEKYNKPAILFTLDGDVGKGSGRSVKGLNLVSALNYASDYLTRFGGHELAAGMTLKSENVDLFRKKINEYAQSVITDESCAKVCEYDLEVEGDSLTLDVAKALDCFEPCGTANEIPVFRANNLVIEEIAPIGNNHHTRLVLSYRETKLQAVLFGSNPLETGLFQGDNVEILCNANVNSFMGKDTLQLMISKIRISEECYSEYEKAMNRFADIQNGTLSGDILKKLIISENLLPTRTEFALLYNYLKSAESTDENILYLNIRKLSNDVSIGMLKLRIMLEIFLQSGLITLKMTAPYSGTFVYTICPVTKKAKLEDTDSYKKIKI